MLDYILDHNHRHSTPLSSKKLREAVIRVMKDEEKYAQRNVKNFTRDIFFQYPITINAQKEDANMTYERRIFLSILVERIK